MTGREFVSRAKVFDVLGYELVVAGIEDVLAGQVWAYSDTTGRASKRKNFLADIMRLIETHPELQNS